MTPKAHLANHIGSLHFISCQFSIARTTKHKLLFGAFGDLV